MKLDSNHDYKNLKLSIQLSLDGFSFYILNLNKGNELLFFKEIGFYRKKQNPKSLEEAINRRLQQEGISGKKFGEVELIHENNLFSLVPNAYFDENQLSIYLERNIKIFSTDYITYDGIESIEAKAVYLPFVNVNNLIISEFGSFEYRHSSEVLLSYLIDHFKGETYPKTVVQINLRSIEIIQLENGKINFFNHFETNSKEDILYYVLFALEQMNIDPENALLHLCGYLRNKEDLNELLLSYIGTIETIVNPKLNLPPNFEKYKHHRHLLNLTCE